MYMLYRLLRFLLLFFFLIIFFSLIFFPIWGYHNFGNVDLEKIIFHLYVPMKDMPTDWTNKIWIPTFLIVFFSIASIVLKKHLKKHKCITCVLFPLLFLFSAIYINKHFGLFNYIKNSYSESKFIKENYISPSSVKISFPRQKRNLIVIQVESLENSVQDKKNGGFFDINYIPNLTEIAKENVSFSHSDLIEGATVLPSTGWTVAGLVAETAGVPLKLYGKDWKKIDNSMSRYTKFLPGVVSLGEILQKNGYRNVFILGTRKGFAGQGNYLKQHGEYLIYDETSIGQKNTQSDKKVFEFSKQIILNLSKNKGPFHVLIQTFDNHFGRMNPEYCQKKFKEDFQNGYICTDLLIKDFISWIKEQDFYKNTTIVILGDHCSMSNSVASGVEIYDGKNTASAHDGNIKRKVYNVFINSLASPIREKNRKFSTIDMFPTMLASIGAHIEGDRLGLGTNLFSNQQSLPEIYGYDYIFEELKKKSFFYNHSLLY